LQKKLKIISKEIIMRYVYVACCFPNISDIMVLENINLSEDKIGRLPFWSKAIQTWISVICQLLYTCTCTLLSVYNFQPHVNFICILDLEDYMLCFLSCVMNWIQYFSHTYRCKTAISSARHLCKIFLSCTATTSFDCDVCRHIFPMIYFTQ
jgi:hypothetical protein